MSTAIQNQNYETIVEQFGSNIRIDLEKGIVHNVKLIGFESKNGRLYPPKVLRASVHVYEGAKVNIDHPDGDPTKPRKLKDRFGIIRSARFVEGSGIHSDFHFNPKHSFAEEFAWYVENDPEALGFSHNALLRMGEKRQHKQLIEEIISVRSMDLVADPATTSSIFEHETTENDKESEMEMEKLKQENAELKAEIKKLQDADSKKSETEAVKLAQKETAELKQKLEQLEAKEKQQQIVEAVDSELEAAGLDKKDKKQVSDLFTKQLLATEGQEDRAALIKDRVALVGSSPRSRQQNNQPVYKPGTGDATEQVDTKEFVSRLLS